MDLPLRGIDLRKRRALRGGAETDELDRVAYCRAVAGEICDHVTVRQPRREFESVEAATARYRVQAAQAVEDVRAPIADQGIGIGGAVGVLEIKQRVRNTARNAGASREVDGHSLSRGVVADRIDAIQAVKYVGGGVARNRVVVAGGV